MLFQRHGNGTKFQSSYFITSSLNYKFIFPGNINTHIYYILKETRTQTNIWCWQIWGLDLFHFHVVFPLRVACLPTRQSHVLIMSPRRLHMTSYFIPLLGLYERLPDVIFRRPIAVHIWHPKDVRKYTWRRTLYATSLTGPRKDD